MIKTIILDMDDTLIESGKYGLEIFEKHLIKNKCKYTKKEVQSIFNEGYTKIFKKILLKNKIPFNEKLLDEMRSDYTKKISNAKLMPYAIELLEAIHDKAIMILATFSLEKQTKIILKNNDLAKYFDKIICADSKLFKHKKYQLKYILDEFKLKPSECILVEDSHYGIKSGIHNKITTIGVRHYYDDLNADFVVDDLHSAKKIILEKLSNGGN
jgi:HAD superfamily hydrolase (TIGR01509 family)